MGPDVRYAGRPSGFWCRKVLLSVDTTLNPSYNTSGKRKVLGSRAGCHPALEPAITFYPMVGLPLYRFKGDYKGSVLQVFQREPKPFWYGKAK